MSKHMFIKQHGDSIELTAMNYFQDIKGTCSDEWHDSTHDVFHAVWKNIIKKPSKLRVALRLALVRPHEALIYAQFVICYIVAGREKPHM